MTRRNSSAPIQMSLFSDIEDSIAKQSEERRRRQKQHFMEKAREDRPFYEEPVPRTASTARPWPRPKATDVHFVVYYSHGRDVRHQSYPERKDAEEAASKRPGSRVMSEDEYYARFKEGEFVTGRL